MQINTINLLWSEDFVLEMLSPLIVVDPSLQVSFLFSDRGIPDGYRHMNGYGSHTFKLVNADGGAVYCKFHAKVLISFFFFNWNYTSYWIKTIKM